MTPRDEFLWNQGESAQLDMLRNQAKGGVCDFCGSTPITHFFATVPQDKLIVVTGDTLQNVINDNDGCWGACDACTSLVESRDTLTLIGRVLTIQHMSNSASVVLAAVYTELFERLTATNSHAQPISELPKAILERLNDPNNPFRATT